MVGFIPANEAEFFFRRESGDMPTDFVVTRKGARLAKLEESGVDLLGDYPQSLGAHVSGWMEEPARTPAGVFATVYLARLELPQIDALINGLHEMARIEGQGWATEMAVSLERWASLKRGKD